MLQKLLLHIKGADSTYKLDRFNCWVNEVPLFGIRGVRINKYNRNTFDTTITIGLSDGENRIETSVTDVNGTESYRMPLAVNYKPVKPAKEKDPHRYGGDNRQSADGRQNAHEHPPVTLDSFEVIEQMKRDWR